MSEKDTYGGGCDPSTACATSYDYDLGADTLDEYLVRLGEVTIWRPLTPDDYELDACDQPGRIDVAGMTTDDACPASEHDIERWKRGELDLWNTIWTVRVERVTRETVELAEAVSA
jgi:hypothetical protein